MAWTWIRSALADVLRPCIAPHRMRVQSVNGCQRVVCLARVRVRARPPRDGVGTSGGRGTESTRVVGRCPSARKYYRPLPLWPL